MPRLIAMGLAVYLLVLAFMYLIQRFLQYGPDRSLPGTPAQNDLPEMSEVIVETEDKVKLLSWFAPPSSPKTGKIIVFFHGNGGHIGHRACKARHFLNHGYGVMLCSYRGYGGNAGSPSEQGLYKDARAALRWLEDQGYMSSQIVIYGTSLGTGVAVQAATEFQPHYLVLEAPFTSAVDIAQAQYPWLPVSILMKDKYDNRSKMPQIQASTLFVHGDEDDIVPMRYGKKLYEVANHPKEFANVNGAGHNDLYDHHAGFIVTDWLEAQEAAS